MKKIIFPILLVILLVLGITIFIDQHKTSDWKTYTDPTFGYSLKYPTNWKIETGGKEGNIRIFNPDKFDQSIKFSPETVEVDPYNQWNIKTPIPQWIEQDRQTFDRECKHGGCGGGSPMILIKEVTIDNKLAYKVWSSDVFGIEIAYLIPYKQTVYSLTLYGGVKNNESDNFDEDGSQLATIFQTMLSSFKFSK